MARARGVVVIVLIGALLPSIALAQTVEELLAWGDRIQASLEVIADDVQACPGGACAGRDEILAAFESAENERTNLVTERQGLGACSTCTQLDARIAALSAASEDIAEVVTTWEEQE